LSAIIFMKIYQIVLSTMLAKLDYTQTHKQTDDSEYIIIRTADG